MDDGPLSGLRKAMDRGDHSFAERLPLEQEVAREVWEVYAHRTVAGVRTARTVPACRPYRNRPRAGTLPRDPFAAALADAVESVDPTMSEHVVAVDGWLFVAHAERDEARCLATATEVARAFESTSAHLAVPGIRVPHQSYVRSERRIVPVAVDDDLAHALAKNETVHRVRRWSALGPELESQLTVVSDPRPPGVEWLGSGRLAIAPRPGIGLYGDRELWGHRLAMEVDGGRLLDRIDCGMSGNTFSVLGIDDPEGEHDAAIVTAASAVPEALMRIAVSPGLAFVDAHHLVEPRHLPLNDWPILGSDPTGVKTSTRETSTSIRVKMAGQEIGLAWATAPRATGRSVLETGPTLRLVDGGDHTHTDLVNAVIAEQGPELGPTRWFLDGRLIVAQGWARSTGPGKRPDGAEQHTLERLLTTIDERLRSEGEHHA